MEKIFKNGFLEDQEGDFGNLVCLIDNDLGDEKPSGSELISSLGISVVSYLITNRFDDPNLMRFCVNEKIKIVPKPVMEHPSVMEHLLV